MSPATRPSRFFSQRTTSGSRSLWSMGMCIFFRGFRGFVSRVLMNHMQGLLTIATVEKLLDGLKPLIKPRLTDPEGKGIHRILISTPLGESVIAEYLTNLAARVEPRGVKVGSYPRWKRTRNTITLVGR